jgi:lysophospholipase L1-like esterase
VALPDYKAGLGALVDRILAAGARLVLLPPTVIGEDPASEGNRLLTGYRAAVREVAAARPGVLVAPTDTDFENALRARGNLTQPLAPQDEPGKTLTTDGVHLRGPGDAVVAVAVLKALNFFPAP